MSAATLNREMIDVLIVGAGITGSLLALQLRDAGLNVHIIEAAAAPVHTLKPQNEYSLRVSAISPASVTALQSVNAWRHLPQQRIMAYQRMTVWESHGAAEINFSATEIWQDQLGFIIENDELQLALLQEINQSMAHTIHFELQPLNYTITDDAINVLLSNGETCRARLVIGADGARSPWRAAISSNLAMKSYFQKAIVAQVRTEHAHQNTAWQRFLSGGPLAFLPLADGSSSIVWSLPQAQAAHYLAESETEFCDALSRALDFRLGKVLSCGTRAAFALQHLHADHYVAPHVALIGDAAHVVHPLAGQGVNLGIADAVCLADVLRVAAQQNKKQLGDLSVLKRYEQQRRVMNATMSLALDGLHHLYINQHPLAIWLRNTGVNAIEHLPMLKRLLMQQAMRT
ncbi:MAG: UbiH/UbiF/VisC/COQ6 family ubiquinone biosynthesis hydroxylase [Gammaproteobacteria bacterium]|nr:UbiH/UbiF/VisC/COQ6 family ubiquinone biosynthesis hydroxylase [Gammaproteobacteria bacterium]